MENEKLIAALRYCDAVVNDTVNTGSCNFCPYRDHCSDLDNEAADALERLIAENAAKGEYIWRLESSNEILRTERDELHKNNCGLRTDRDRLQTELDAAKKCINDVQTYLELGSAKYIAATIKQWRGKENGDDRS